MGSRISPQGAVNLNRSWAGNPLRTPRARSGPFPDRESAIAYAEAHGIDYPVTEPKRRRVKPKAYADNFAFTRNGAWTLDRRIGAPGLAQRQLHVDHVQKDAELKPMPRRSDMTESGSTVKFD